MASTTNYSWSTPDDTALVKDGAAAIRSLGSAIDSTVFTNASAAINKTIVDAKGDIIAATAADTVSRLAVGSNDQVLIADSTTATGLKWGTPSAGGMTLVASGSMSGTTVSITGISSSYKDLIVRIYDVNTSSGGDTLRMRLNNLSTSIYGIQLFTATAFGVTATSSSFNIQYDPGTADSFIEVYIPSYSNTVSNKFINLFHGTGGANPDQYWGWGVCKTSTAVSEVSFFTDSGYTFNTGTYEVYGVK